MIDYTPINLLREQVGLFSEMQKICSDIPGADQMTPMSIIDGFTYNKASINPKLIDRLVNSFISGMNRIDKTYTKYLCSDDRTFNTELRDAFIFPLILEEWSKAKQVFKPDADFADALLHTDKLCITSNMIDHLPYNLFYIDLSSCEYFSPIDGVFVFVKKYDNIASINLYTVTKNLTYFSFYLNGPFDEHGCLNIDLSELANVYYDNIWKPILFDTVTEDVTQIKISRKTVNVFALQLIAYLSIEKPQLTESDLTKNTYRKPSAVSKVKNKWSEIRIQDVGIKYETDFRKTVTKYKQENIENNTTSKRKSPMPHFRCAHWHKFWVGKGRKELRLMWIEPIFVGNGESKDVVIHKVKKD